MLNFAFKSSIWSIYSLISSNYPSFINHLLYKKKKKGHQWDSTTLICHIKPDAWFTDRCQSTVAFSHCSAASNEPDNKKEGSNCNDDDCWDESIHVFKEVIVVIVCNEDIGSNIAQDTSSSLWVTKTSKIHSRKVSEWARSLSPATPLIYSTKLYTILCACF